MSSYDPDPDKPYGECVTCGVSLATQEDAKAHRADTRPANMGSSHSTRSTNPSRTERIESELQRLADDALYDFVDQAEDLLDDGVTEDEIKAAMRMVDADFSDAWEKDR